MSKSNPVHLWRFGRTRALISYVPTLWPDFNINGQIGFHYPPFPHILHSFPHILQSFPHILQSETHFLNIYLTLPPSSAIVIFRLIHPSRVVNKHLPKEFEEQRKPHHSEWHLCSSMRTHPSTIMETIKRKRSSQAAFTFTEALLKLIYLSPEKKYIYSSTFLWPDNSKGPCAVPTNPKHRQRHLQRLPGSSLIGGIIREYQHTREY